MAGYTMIAPKHTKTHTDESTDQFGSKPQGRMQGGEGWVKVQQNELTLDYNHEFINLIFLNS